MWGMSSSTGIIWRQEPDSAYKQLNDGIPDRFWCETIYFLCINILEVWSTPQENQGWIKAISSRSAVHSMHAVHGIQIVGMHGISRWSEINVYIYIYFCQYSKSSSLQIYIAMFSTTIESQ